jgi:hypothetical protein
VFSLANAGSSMSKDGKQGSNLQINDQRYQYVPNIGTDMAFARSDSCIVRAFARNGYKSRS